MFAWAIDHGGPGTIKNPLDFTDKDTEGVNLDSAPPPTVTELPPIITGPPKLPEPPEPTMPPVNVEGDIGDIDCWSANPITCPLWMSNLCSNGVRDVKPDVLYKYVDWTGFPMAEEHCAALKSEANPFQ
jgi:hypothetical protein